MALLPVVLAVLALLPVGAALAWQRPVLLPLAILILAAEYLTTQGVQWPAINPTAPVYAGGLLLLAEVGSWSLEPLWPRRADPDLNRRRALHIAGIVLVAIVIDAVLLLVATLPVPSNLALTVAGGVAAAGGLALVALLARRMIRRTAAP
ncbi:MAG TPA: hypothetical protein VGP33_10810 [Chloroflexota bacterium]|nr:hypothetical protein [Chloroflexota bacterium]